MVIGAGPIVIGQACEFDYSGTQACKALKDEGYRVILVNSNPATIMTDPEFADATYVEPITPAIVARIIAAEKPDALLPTMGGQTALNTALALADDGTLARHGVDLIGASRAAIEIAEDREAFREAMGRSGWNARRAGSRARSTRPARRSTWWGCRPSSGPPTPWAAPAAASPTTVRSSPSSPRPAWMPRPPARSWSRNRCSAGKSSRWRSCATRPTTPSSSAPSRTWTRWASTPAIRSPWRRRSRSPTRSIN